MNNKRILQTIGIIFLLITTSAFSKEDTSGQQKNNSTTIENLKQVKVFARATAYPPNADSETAEGKTASLIPIKKVTDLGLECIAVDPKVIPYGSFIIGKDKNGNTIQGVAVDTGGSVKSRKAAINLAEKKGYSEDSPQARALVLDFYSDKGEITKAWDTFTVIVYKGPCFKFDLNQSEKLNHIIRMKTLYGKKA
jgi:3D (Asp-Asp-Asp) domain-containing protein